MKLCHRYVKKLLHFIQDQIVIGWLKYMAFVFDDIGGGEGRPLSEDTHSSTGVVRV